MKTDLELAKYFKDENVEWITRGEDTQYTFIKNGSENILIFAPSNSKIDWYNNLQFFKKPYKTMNVNFYVHTGFLKCWNLVKKDIIEVVKDFDNLTIVGWSYGGALATLCTEEIWYQFKHLRNKMHTVTFGAPRVFCRYNLDKIQERFSNMTLYKNGSDIVTCLPLEIMGYKHVKLLTRIGDKPKFLEYFKPMQYHHIDCYIKSLEDLK